MLLVYIRKKLMHEEATEKVKTQSRDLKQLAQECMKDFEVSDLIHSEDVPVKRAVNLNCVLHISPKSSRSQNTTSSTANLWKQ